MYDYLTLKNMYLTEFVYLSVSLNVIKSLTILYFVSDSSDCVSVCVPMLL